MKQVREYGRITCDASQVVTRDRAVVTPETFEWLLKLKADWRGENIPLHMEGRKSLKLDSFVGYLESPTGESIEVLPKTKQELPAEDEVPNSRRLLQRMLSASLGMKSREADAAHLKRYSEPLHEWVMGRFLSELSWLVRRGIRSDYQNVEEESRFIRGRLDMARQLRQRPDRATWFHIQHDVFSPDILENRLLATALSYVRKLVKTPDNWRLASELSLVMVDIPTYHDPSTYLNKWRSAKLMRAYDAVRPWCQLIIEKLNPQFQKGTHRGIALLFPMERLFESYVASVLRRQLRGELKTQASSRYLVNHQPVGEPSSKKWFQLKPDLLLKTRYATYVMDTKWKLLDENACNGDGKYKISQPDMYQLFAYGHKYMHGKGHMALIYPKHPGFSQPLPCFSYSDELHLWAVPFDLDEDKLVAGEWEKYMPQLAGRKEDKVAG